MSKLLAFVALAVSGSLAAELVGPYAQCGGIGYTGDTSCYPGYACIKLNDWYHQCQPTEAQPTVVVPSVPVPTSSTPTVTVPTSTATPTSTPTVTQTTPTFTPTVTTPAPTPTSSGPPRPSASAGGLQDKIANKGKIFFGACADPGTLGNSANVDVLRREFGQVTPENSMKWDATEPNRGQFNFGNADRLVDWATTNGKLIRGHTLVWHSQLPGWVNNINDRNTLTQVITNHIQTVAGRYAGKIFHWDVINEIFNEDGSLRQSVFSRVMGESFVPLAFQEARKADPKAILYINDYNLDSNNAKVRGVVSLVNRVNQANPGTIDGIGTQAHLQAGQGGAFIQALTALAAATVNEVAVTELDIAGAPSNDYAQVVRACLQTPKCVGVTVWGVRDTDSWRANTNPLLFDANFRPKAAYNAVLAEL